MHECRVYEIDGASVRIQSAEPLTSEQIEALGPIVRAARRQWLDDAIKRGPGAEAIRAGRALYRQERMRIIREKGRHHA
jgi:hypothetical protein